VMPADGIDGLFTDAQVPRWTPKATGADALWRSAGADAPPGGE